jgi:hypothetical protein
MFDILIIGAGKLTALGVFSGSEWCPTPETDLAIQQDRQVSALPEPSSNVTMVRSTSKSSTVYKPCTSFAQKHADIA